MKKEIEKIDEYKIVFDEETMKGVYEVAFVRNPATRQRMIALSDNEKYEDDVELMKGDRLFVKFSEVDNYKKRVTGALIVPDQKILRVGKDGKPYYIQFSKEEIEKIASNFMKKKATDKTNHEHDHSKRLDGNYVLEAYMISDDLQHKKLNLPVGSFVLTYQIADQKYFEEEILTGNVTGFSLEGFFGIEKVAMAEEKQDVQVEAEEKEFDFFKDVLYIC